LIDFGDPVIEIDPLGTFDPLASFNKEHSHPQQQIV
jgi:hypothetical protein